MTEKAGPRSTVYDRLLDKIASGSLLPTTKLVERTLAEELGVSRIPLRESFARLAALGLIVSGANKQGMRLRDYSPLEVRQMYEFREMIEAGAARTAARAATESDVLRLETVCGQMEAEMGRPNKDRWIALDRKFHETLAEVGRNERFLAAMKALMAECSYIFYLQTRTEQALAVRRDRLAHERNVLQQHRRIVDRVRQGNPDGAEKAARRHMRCTCAWALELLISRDLHGRAEDWPAPGAGGPPPDAPGAGAPDADGTGVYRTPGEEDGVTG